MIRNNFVEMSRMLHECNKFIFVKMETSDCSEFQNLILVNEKDPEFNF